VPLYVCALLNAYYVHVRNHLCSSVNRRSNVGFFICALYRAPPPCRSACSPYEPFAYRPYQTRKARESGRAYKGGGHKNSTGSIEGATKLAQSKEGNLKGPPTLGVLFFYMLSEVTK
jgi:hypothetical protein